jgi:hypothetical protein
MEEPKSKRQPRAQSANTSARGAKDATRAGSKASAGSTENASATITPTPRHLQQVDLGEELKAAFHTLCQQQGHTPSQLLRRMVRHIVDNNPVASNAARAGSEEGSEQGHAPALTASTTYPDLGTTRLELRLRRSELAHLTARAEAGGDNVQRVVIGLVRNYLANEAPITSHELNVLSESNTHLAMLENTLHRMTTASAAVGTSPSTGAAGSASSDLQDIRRDIATHIAQVQVLLAAQQFRGVLLAASEA